MTRVLSNRLVYAFDRALLTLQVISQRHELLRQILLLQRGLASQPVQHVLMLVRLRLTCVQPLRQFFDLEGG